jgi:hypothetical protein
VSAAATAKCAWPPNRAGRRSSGPASRRRLP